MVPVPPKTSLLDEMSLALPYVLTVLAVVVGLGAGVGLWFLFSQPSLNEERNARMAILVAGTTIGTVAMLLGFKV